MTHPAADPDWKSDAQKWADEYSRISGCRVSVAGLSKGKVEFRIEGMRNRTLSLDRIREDLAKGTPPSPEASRPSPGAADAETDLTPEGLTPGQAIDRMLSRFAAGAQDRELTRFVLRYDGASRKVRLIRAGRPSDAETLAMSQAGADAQTSMQ